MRRILFIMLLAFAGCQQLPPTPADTQARRFETIPDMSVIYIVRDNPDHNTVPATLLLDERMSVTTYEGTYYRWEVPPGEHRITGMGADVGRITLQTQAGRIYFVRQWTAPFMGYASSYFKPVEEQEARAVIARSTLVP
jgi:hypothetical protein